MFEHLKEYRKIIVTGPQRSGTRICAAMIAHDTGYYFVDERTIAIDSIDKFCHLVYDAKYWELPVVIQCPGLSRWVHRFPKLEEMAVVWMNRNLIDILDSQKRIGWKNDFIECLKYPNWQGPAAQVKYAYFMANQEPNIPNVTFVDYVDLDRHPLWIPKEQRKDFVSNQISQEGDVLDIKVLVEADV